MSVHDDKVWAGTESSLQAAIQAEEARATHIAAGTRFKEEEQAAPRLLEVDGGIAIVSVKGPLTNSNDAWWNEYVGQTGYGEIRDAMIAAAHDPEVKHIVIDVDSGGGAVSGVADTASLIRLVHDKVKPVTAFASGSMFSAAYWLGSAAGEVHMSAGSGVGSIGVIATHMERSQMLKEAGIGVTVVRAGKYKALANSVEPLSEEGRKQIQAGVDSAYKIFVNHVADMRGKSYEYADSVMAQGREFYGSAAVDASLVDGIATFDALVSRIREKYIDGSINQPYNRGKQPSGMRVESQGDLMKTLSEQDIAALAAGAALNADASQSASNAAGDVANEAHASTEQGAAATETVAEPAVQASQQVDTSMSAITVLSQQLKSTQDDLLAARLELAKAGDKVSQLEAVVTPLKDIAARAINNMRVALRSSPLDMSATSATQILADHASISADFAKQYPVGGVASTDAAVSSVKNEQPVDALAKARLNAVRFSK